GQSHLQFAPLAEVEFDSRVELATELGQWSRFCSPANSIDPGSAGALKVIDPSQIEPRCGGSCEQESSMLAGIENCRLSRFPTDRGEVRAHAPRNRNHGRAHRSNAHWKFTSGKKNKRRRALRSSRILLLVRSRAMMPETSPNSGGVQTIPVPMSTLG